MLLTPDLTIRETAKLSGVTYSAVEKAVESKVIRVINDDGAVRGASRRFLPLRAVAYFVALKEAKLVDLPLRHKRKIWAELSRLEESALGPVEFSPGTSLDVERLAARTFETAIEYKRARDNYIVSEPDILGGTPVIKGTRLTVYSVAGRLQNGESLENLTADYPDIPRAAFAAADVFAKTHPLRGRPTGRPWRRSVVN